jgi:hypothetical protein
VAVFVAVAALSLGADHANPWNRINSWTGAVFPWSRRT